MPRRSPPSCDRWRVIDASTTRSMSSWRVSYNPEMRYLVTARVKPGRRDALDHAIDNGTLGRGSIAGDEYFRNMDDARELEDGCVQWVEVCYCPTPLAE